MCIPLSFQRFLFLPVCEFACCLVARRKKTSWNAIIRNRNACKRGCSRDNGNKSEDGNPDVDVGGLFDDKP